MFLGLEIKHKIDQGPFESCPPVHINRETAPRDAAARLEIDQLKIDEEIVLVLALKVQV